MALKFNEPALGRVVDECVRPALDRTAFKLRIFDRDAACRID